MEFDNLFNSLWNMAKGLIEVMGVVWNWLVNPLDLSIPGLVDLPLIGIWFNWDFKYSPLELIGTGILLLLVLWVIKHLIPLG